MFVWNLTTHLQARFPVLLFACLTACIMDDNQKILYEHPGYHFPYELSGPSRSWKLPAELHEISGLSYTDDSRLACVEDESGRIYIFNPETSKVELKLDFDEAGDFEGIEIIENDAWILKSNGNLFEVTDYLENAVPVVKKHNTALSGKNDAEGLTYDPVHKNLLIACKENPYADDEKGKNYKAVYSFSLETKQLDINPYLMIHLDTIRFHKGDAGFKPSGLAVHPVNGDIFILGSAGKLLLVYSGKGEMLAMISLPPSLFPQPEGICFSPDGVLYIANEGAGGEGTILRFEPVSQ
jgi:uncharacterized protein YjiK